MNITMAADAGPKRTPSNPRTLSPPDSPIDDAFREMRPVSLTGLLSDATLYNQVIAHEDPESSPSTQNVQDFADLVGHDLDPDEMEMANRYAQLSLNDWAALDLEAQLEEAGDSGESSSDADTSSMFSHDGASSTSSSKSAAHFDAADPALRVDGADNASVHDVIPPKELVNILIEEFGQLGPDGEETLLAEVDGAIIQDVIVLVRSFVSPCHHSC